MTGAIDLQKLFRRCLKFWYLFVLCSAIAVYGAWYMLRLETPQYMVSGTIIIEDDQTESAADEFVMSRGFPIRNKFQLENELQLIKSRSLMRRVIDSIHLTTSYHWESPTKPVEMYDNCPVQLVIKDGYRPSLGSLLRIRMVNDSLFHLIKGEQDSVLCEFGAPFNYRSHELVLNRVPNTYQVNPVIQIRFHFPEGLARQYAGKLQLRRITQSNVFQVSMEDAVPKKAKDIIHSLVNVYNEVSLKEKNKSTGKSLNFIEDRLRFVTRELYSVEQEIVNKKRQSKASAGLSTKANQLLQEMTATNEELVDLRFQKLLLEQTLDFLNDPDNDFELISINSSAVNPSIARLVDDYNSKLLERQRLLMTATADNPAVKSAETVIRGTRSNIVQGIRLAISNLREKETRLESDLQPINQEFDLIPQEEREVVDIMRQQEIKESLFLFLLQKREEVAMKLASETSDTRILDAPETVGQTSPSKKRFYGLALLLGLALPAGVIFLIDRIDSTVHSVEEVQAKLTAPLLGSIAVTKKKGIVVLRNSKSAVAEMFRMLRTNLQFFTNGKKEQVLLVTSSIEGEGKSFVSLNLGASMALANKKTVVVEFDLRKPGIVKKLNFSEKQKGITAYLSGEVKRVEQIATELKDHPNLYVIPAGILPPNPAELILQDKVEQLINELRSKFDAVILDTPPVGLVTDALLIDRFSDVTLFIVRLKKAQRVHLRALEDIYTNKKMKKPVIIVNGVKGSNKYRYYA